MATIDASRLEHARRERGLSQRALAAAAEITRQAVGAIERGRMQPSVGIALRLARALETSVEDLFGEPVPSQAPAPVRAACATIAGREVTYPLVGDHLAIEPAQCDGITAFVGGCELSAGLLARHTSERSREVRALWISMTNRAALDALGDGRLHAAFTHDPPHGRPADPLFKRFVVASTQAGWLMKRGNPLGFRGAADLVRSRARLANRPKGAAARALLDAQLRHAGVGPQRVRGYARELAGQLDAGRAVAQDFADVAIASAGVASHFDLAFAPLRAEQCTLTVAADALRTPAIRALIDALRSERYRRDLLALQAYDTSHTGERLP